MIGAPIRRQDPPSGEGTIKDRSRPGRSAFGFAPLDVPEASIPDEARRRTDPGLPEVSEIDLVRHYTRLSQMNYGVDTGFYPLGSCTMKYNPKVAETVAALPGFQRMHPLQPDQTAQGALEMLWRLEQALCEITGMARATLQPPAGACGEMTGLLMMRAYHAERGGGRTKVIIPDSAHGTNPASVHLAGFQAVPVPSDARGLVDVSVLEKLVDEEVAGLMLTNPNTLGLFEQEIEEIARIVHGVGGLVYYDGANLNAILGRCRPGDMGFDIVHINTHKTFATPHGGGGPGAGPVGVVEELVPYLPAPIVQRDDATGTFRWDEDRPRSIGRLHGYHGNAGVLVRAYAYVFLHGADGLKAVSELAALNANYLASLIARRLPARVPGWPADARVRGDGEGIEGRHRDPGDGRREAADRPRVPPIHRLLPARRRRGHDGRAHRDRDEGDARGVRRGHAASRRGGQDRPGPAARGARHDAGPPAGRGTRGQAPQAPMGVAGHARVTPSR